MSVYFLCFICWRSIFFQNIFFAGIWFSRYQRDLGKYKIYNKHLLNKATWNIAIYCTRWVISNHAEVRHRYHVTECNNLQYSTVPNSITVLSRTRIAKGHCHGINIHVASKCILPLSWDQYTFSFQMHTAIEYCHGILLNIQWHFPISVRNNYSYIPYRLKKTV